MHWDVILHQICKSITMLLALKNITHYEQFGQEKKQTLKLD